MKKLLFLMLISASILFISCKKEETKPDITEKITLVRLIFSPFDNGAPSIFTATDKDGKGSTPFEPDLIRLKSNTTYNLFIELENVDDTIDVSATYVEEDHKFYFAFNEVLFLTPSETGNIIDPLAPIIYEDFDQNQLPVGAITSWAVGEVGQGTFRILLKHFEEGTKSESSKATEGQADIDITWEVSVE